MHQTDSNPGPHDHQPNTLTTRLPTAAAQLMENLSYLCSQLINVYVASPDPDVNPRGGGELPDPDANPRGGGELPNPKSAIIC